MKWIENLYFVGVAQSVFFALLLFTKRKKQLSDWVLLFYILMLGGDLLLIIAIKQKWYMHNPQWALFDIAYWLLLGPALLIYTQLISQSGKKLHRLNWLILLPILIVLAGFYEYIFIDTGLFFTNYEPSHFLFKISKYIWLYNSFVYYIIIIFLLYKHQKNVKLYFSYTAKINLKWLNILSHGFAVFLFFLLFFPRIQQVFGFKVTAITYDYAWMTMVLYIFALGYYGYKQQHIFGNFRIQEIQESKSESFNRLNFKNDKLSYSAKEISTNISYKKSGLSETEARQLAVLLHDLMLKDKPYLDCELDLAKLAKMMNISINKLSQVINANMGKNFFELINEYRVAEVKKRLLEQEYQKVKILAVAYDCGFNSKSTFYTQFKKITSVTPAEFILLHAKSA